MTYAAATATREVFGNVPDAVRVGFYIAIALSCAFCVVVLARRALLWHKGKAGDVPQGGVFRLLSHGLLQSRVLRGEGGVTHTLIFYGFLVLTLGTTLLAISHAGPVQFHEGWYYLIYEATLDLFGVAFCAGCLVLGVRRLRNPVQPPERGDRWTIALLLGIGLSGFVVEALRLVVDGVEGPDGHLVHGGLVACCHSTPLGRGDAADAHVLVWILHALLVCVFFLVLPVSRLRHIVTGPLHLLLAAGGPRGALKSPDDKAMESGIIGASSLFDFSRIQLLGSDACMGCGRCEDACPAFASGKPLSPKGLVGDLRDLLAAGPDGPALHDETISADTLWACTMCQACVQACPVLIDHVDLIVDMRRHRVGEGELAGPPADALRNVETRQNPFGQPNASRTAWAEGLDVPTVEDNPDFDVLLWVGCAAAFDPRAQKVARALVALFRKAGVDFAILGDRERCTGDAARRMGDEFLFQEMAETNVATLNEHRVRRIVTPCPHCLNTLKNEYPVFGGSYDVVHHARFLADLHAEGRLPIDGIPEGELTFHDPCYLARVNGEVEAPRALIRAGKPDTPPHRAVKEMPRNGKDTFCCGAGGGRMWFEEEPGQRVANIRAHEAAGTGADTLVTACPFCLNMMSDGVRTTKHNIRVTDIAELLSNGTASSSAIPVT